MGQRHNRRRTRPRSRNCSVNLTSVPLDAIATPANFCTISYPSAFDCLGNRPASTRHHQGLTWQERDDVLKPEAAMLETEQYRLFGGEPGDDVGLCYRMLEYFGGLDYINPLQNFKPLPG
ncbi:hypothetical protein BDW59DRAFT_147897 [Aspergillus cavernicola]|uniref:Uncharacterized protein n=1 Tax=Aspergillus cavernicola TaxID=176166 RepID=A0ABR4I903_9EURO